MTAQENGDQAAYRRPSLPAGRVPYRPYTLSPDDAGWLIEDVWPTVYFGSERVAEMQRKVKTLPWAKKALDLMRQEAEMALALPPQLPVVQCGWRHDFYSRKTAAHLLYEPDRNDSFLDPSTGEREGDPAQHKAWALLTHERTYRMMRSMGFLYRLTGDERFARWVADGMRQAADYFTHKEFHQKGALYFSHLYDSGILLLLANVYDLTRQSPAYSKADHERIRANIFEERTPSVVAFLDRSGAHNMACFAAAAVARVGQLLDRPDWTQRALEGRAGLRTQLLQGVREANGAVDGFWLERTMFYHFYALCPLVTLYETEKQVKGPVDAELRRRFEAMFSAPLELVDEQLRLPVVGDLGAPRTMNLAAYRHLYEYAAGQLDSKRFAPALAAIYKAIDAPRTDLTALAFGPDELPSPGGLPTKSTLLPVARMGVFRRAEPQAFRLLFRAGKFAGGHDHPDRLSVFLHALGEPISPDLGTPGYSLHALNGHYYRSTIAHNTLFADESDLKGEATLDWRPEASPPQAHATMEVAGVSYRRTVFFDPPYIVLVDEFQAEEEHRFGWIYHAYGDVKVTMPTLSASAQPALVMPPLPDKKAWAMLTERHATIASDEVKATWRVTERINMGLTTRSDGVFEVTAARGPGQPYADRQGVLIFRAPGRVRRFATALEVYADSPTVKAMALEPSGEVSLKLTDGTERVYMFGR
jgi:hypothetical protein